MSQDVQTRFPVQLAFAKFLSKIKVKFLIQCQYHGYSTPSEIFLHVFILFLLLLFLLFYFLVEDVQGEQR